MCPARLRMALDLGILDVPCLPLLNGSVYSSILCLSHHCTLGVGEGEQIFCLFNSQVFKQREAVLKEWCLSLKRMEIQHTSLGTLHTLFPLPRIIFPHFPNWLIPVHSLRFSLKIISSVKPPQFHQLKLVTMSSVFLQIYHGSHHPELKCPTYLFVSSTSP